MELKFKRLASKNQYEVTVPQFATEGSAGLDLRSADHYVINPGCRALISTCLSVEIPANFVGMVCSRSGLALKNGVFVLNAPGIIDSDYRGELGVILQNSSEEVFTITPGDRVAQLLVLPVMSSALSSIVEISESTTTERGSGGFGSTGVN